MISLEGATPLAAFTGIERNGSCILDIVPESWAGPYTQTLARMIGRAQPCRTGIPIAGGVPDKCRSRAGNSREHQCFTQLVRRARLGDLRTPRRQERCPGMRAVDGSCEYQRPPVRCRSCASDVASSAVSVMVTVTSAPRAAAMRSRVGTLGEIRPPSRRAMADWVVPTSSASCRWTQSLLLPQGADLERKPNGPARAVVAAAALGAVGAAGLHLVPGGAAVHGEPSSMAMWPSSMQRCMARRARSISDRSLGLVLANTVQHNDPSGGDVVDDAGLSSAEVAAELWELPVELSGERLAAQDALVGQQVDVALDVAELIVGGAVEPGGHLGFSSTGTPRHSGDAIGLWSDGAGTRRGLRATFVPLWAAASGGQRWPAEADGWPLSRANTRHAWLGESRQSPSPFLPR